MKIGPINLSQSVSLSPAKDVQVRTSQNTKSIVWGQSFPVAINSDVVEYSFDVPVFTGSGIEPGGAAANRALAAQLLELAQNPEWQRAGIYLTMREDFTDAQDGWYGIASVSTPEDDPSYHGWLMATVAIALRGRRTSAIGTFVDGKAQDNDFALGGTTMGAYPQGIGSGYPAATYSLAASDGSTIGIVEGPPSVMRAPFSSGINCMTKGRCAALDTNGTTLSTEIFHPDHLLVNANCQIHNGLVRYTIVPGTPGHPLVEVYNGTAWATVGNYQLQSYSGSVYTALALREFNLLVVSPDEIIWEERRYDTGSTAYARVVNRIRRGSRLIETQIISASGQGLTGAQSVALTNTTASAANTTADLTAGYGTPTAGSNKALPGFCYLTSPPTAATFASTNLYSGLSVPAGTVTRASIFAGLTDAQWTTLATSAAYVTKWSSYNRTRVRQRIVIG